AEEETVPGRPPLFVEGSEREESRVAAPQDGATRWRGPRMPDLGEGFGNRRPGGCVRRSAPVTMSRPSVRRNAPGGSGSEDELFRPQDLEQLVHPASFLDRHSWLPE